MITKELDFFTFVIMPFNSGFDDVYRLGIKEAAKDCGVKAERLDEQLFGEGMLDRIYRQLIWLILSLPIFQIEMQMFFMSWVTLMQKRKLAFFLQRMLQIFHLI